MTPQAYIAAHGTTRWHTNHQVPAQTVADHAAGVVAFVLWLEPKASSSLIYEALHHDDGEGRVGDMPGPAKRKYPYAADRVALAENLERGEMDVHERELSKGDAALLRLADQLDAFSWAATMAPPHVIRRHDWRKQSQRMIGDAWSIGTDVGAKVEGWIQEMYHAD